MKKKKLVAAAMSLILLMTGCSNVKDQKESAGTSVSSSAVVEDTKMTDSVKASSEPYNFEFKELVTSDMYRDTMGEDIYQAYVNFTDAVMNGETEFECSCEDSFNWVMYHYIRHYSPCVDQFVEPSYFEDGVGHFYYTIPEDEFRQKLADWEVMVTDIINNCGIQEDDSDFEKALLIYLYIADHYSYDITVRDRDDLGAYRFLTEDGGICYEISLAYTYLLAQVGVDSAVAWGPSDNPETTDEHEWVILNLNGTYYNVDPTWAIGNYETLDYFLFSDDSRYYNYGEYAAENTTRVSTKPYVDPDYVSPYMCNDDTFDFFQCSTFIELDHENNILYYMSCGTAGATDGFDFSDYT